MALAIKIGIINYDDKIVITDNTGDYNAVSNPGGWGSPNTVHTTPSPVSAVNLDIYLPSTTTSIGISDLISTTFFTTTDRAYDLFNDVTSVVPTFTLQDGIWKYIINFAGSGIIVPPQYSLRVNDLVCSIGKLALSDMETNNYAEVKFMYDRMVQAFECADYTLAQDLFDEITLMLSDSDCNSWSIGSSCGC
jgi:hypothetical protein